MRELEATLQQFGEFLLKGRLVKEKAAPHCVRWVRRFLTRPAATGPLCEQVRHFCDSLEREGFQDWQVRQAEQALRIYWLHFHRTTDWVRRPASAGEAGRVEPLAASTSSAAASGLATTRTEPRSRTSTGPGASWPT